MFRKLYLILCDFKRQMVRKNIGSFAASTAFFLFLSLMPMLIMLCTIIPYTNLTEDILLKAVTDVVPDMLDPLVVGIVSDVYDKSAGVLSIAVLVTLWSAGKGMLALIRGLNEINEVEEKRNYFVLRAIASFYTLIMLVGMVLTLIINVFGNVLLDIIFAKVPRTRMLFDFAMNFRFLAVWAFLAVVFTALYAYVPNKKLKFRAQIPGAAFSAVAWSAFSWGFSVYVETTNGFGTYGSLSLVILTMLWIYFCVYIVLIGAQINRYFSPVYQFFFGKRRKKS